MAVGERSRRELQEALMEAIGPDQTDTLFGYLPPVGWADVATTRDVAALGDAVRGEMATLGGDLRGEMAELRVELRGEMAELRVELRGEMAALGGDLRGEMAALRVEMHHELRVQFYWLVTLQFATLSILLTALATGLLG